MQNGYLLKRADGCGQGASVWQWDRWQSGMGADGASEWISQTPRRVAGTPPSCARWSRWVWTRSRPTPHVRVGGERIPTDVVYHDGSDPVRMHNYYPQLYNRCVF